MLDNTKKPAVDRRQLQTFFDVVFAHVVADGPGKVFVSLRAFTDDASKSVFAVESVDLFNREAVVAAAFQLAKQCAAAAKPTVFCAPTCTFDNPKTAAMANVVHGPMLSIECDGNPEQAKATLEARLGPATIVVQSGGVWTNPQTGLVEDKLHLHWRLATPAMGNDIERLKQARIKASALVGGDATARQVIQSAGLAPPTIRKSRA
jgi:hypothetical protein